MVHRLHGLGQERETSSRKTEGVQASLGEMGTENRNGETQDCAKQKFSRIKYKNVYYVYLIGTYLIFFYLVWFGNKMVLF